MTALWNKSKHEKEALHKLLSSLFLNKWNPLLFLQLKA